MAVVPGQPRWGRVLREQLVEGFDGAVLVGFGEDRSHPPRSGPQFGRALLGEGPPREGGRMLPVPRQERHELGSWEVGVRPYRLGELDQPRARREPLRGIGHPEILSPYTHMT